MARSDRHLVDLIRTPCVAQTGLTRSGDLRFDQLSSPRAALASLTALQYGVLQAYFLEHQLRGESVANVALVGSMQVRSLRSPQALRPASMQSYSAADFS